VITAAGDPGCQRLGEKHCSARGNITGFAASETAIAGKRLELLKEAAPGLARVAVVYNPDLIGSGVGPL